MKYFLTILSIFYLIFEKSNTSSTCPDCLGKIHASKELELTKQELIINKKDICLHEKYKFFIIVKSGNFTRRNLTRSTWAKEMIEYFNIPILYAIGYPKDTSLQNEILLENQIYKDLLQFNIIENYYNLTLKTTSVLYWYNTYCSNSSQYLFYVDDDVLIHVHKFIRYIQEYNRTNTIEGWFEKSGKIQRSGLGGVSKEDFYIDIVPDYLWGAAVLYPTNVISDFLLKFIYNVTIPIFFRDDVFINGYIAEQANITRKYMDGVLLYDHTEDDLLTNMIIINFENEIYRQNAWICYKYEKNCNKNLKLLLLKVCGSISFGTIILISFWKYFKKTKFYDYIKYKLNRWYYRINYTYKNSINTEFSFGRRLRSMIVSKLNIQWLINWRRIKKKLIFISVCIFIMVLYYIIIIKNQ